MNSFLHIDLENVTERIYVLWIDLQDKSANVLTSELVDELSAILKDIPRKIPNIQGLVIASKKPGQFIAGANVEEIFKITDAVEATHKARLGQNLMKQIAEFPVPTLALIDGPALGGGLELALACTYRICSDGSHVQLGLPETQLGILPGWGGTQRLPATIGLLPAMDMILSGKRLGPKQAKKLGLVDDVAASPILLSVALKWLTGEYTKSKSKVSFIQNWVEKLPPLRAMAFKTARKTVLKKTKGFYPAPLTAIEVLDRTYGQHDSNAYDLEARKLGELLTTPACKSLVSLFLATEQTKRTKFASLPRPVQSIGVVGAGVMGGGIAHLAISRGKRARMKDISSAAVQLGMNHVSDLLKKDQRRKKESPRYAYNQWTMLTATLGYDGFDHLDLVIEAVVEDMTIKKKVFQDLASATQDHTILATNTSGLSITRIAETVKNPQRVVGLHFFNPVAKMPLVEIIRGEQTSEETVATLYKCALDLKKTPIVVKDSPGFLVNRILGLYMSEAMAIALEGTPLEVIEDAMKGFGMPMGPFELFDEVGLDVAQKVGKHLSQSFEHFPKSADVIDKMIAAGLLGKKSKKGFYIHAGTGKAWNPDLPSFGLEYKAEREETPPKYLARISERLTYLMVNEASRCLEEKIIASPIDIDLGMVLGTGFAPFRGGLMRYANSQGLRRVYDRLLDLAQGNKKHFEPTHMLHELAKSDGEFQLL